MILPQHVVEEQQQEQQQAASNGLVLASNFSKAWFAMAAGMAVTTALAWTEAMTYLLRQRQK